MLNSQTLVKKSLKKRVITFFAINLAAVLLIFTLLEIAFRGYYYLKLGKEQYRHHSLINAGVRCEGDDDPRSNNFDCYSSKDIEVFKNKNTFRILVLGGSAVAGTPPINWPDMLTDRLNKESRGGRHFEVINGGAYGACSSRELFVLSKTIYLDPDLVLIYDGFNDIYFSHFAKKGYDQYEKGRHEAVFSLEDRSKFTLRRLSEFYLWLDTFSRKLKNRNRPAAPKSEGPPPNEALPIPPHDIHAPVTESAGSKDIFTNYHGTETTYHVDLSRPITDQFSAQYSFNIREMFAYCKKRNIPCVLATQPTLMFYKHRYKPTLETEYVIDSRLPKYQDWILALKELYPKLISVSKKLADESGFQYFDLTDIFGEMKVAEDYFVDDVHQTPLGKKVITEAVFRALNERKIVPLTGHAGPVIKEHTK